MVTELIVRSMLMGVIDPEMGVSIVDMGLIYNIDIKDNAINIDMTLTNPGCPQGPEIIAEIKQSLKVLDGIDAVNVNLIWSPPWNPEMMSEEAQEMLAGYYPSFKIG